MRAADLERLAIVAEADEVLCEPAFFFLPAAALHDCVRAEALPGKAGENFARWNVFVCGGPAAVGLLGEYRWRNLAEAFGFDGSGAAGEVHRAVAACPGESCDCHNMGPFLNGAVEDCGGEAEQQKPSQAEHERFGAVNKGERRAKRKAGGGCCSECHSEDGF